MILRIIGALGRAYVNHLLVFAIGASVGAAEAFGIVATIYHAGVCR